MSNDQVEITQVVDICAAIYFWVDRHAWAALSAEEKRKEIGDRIDAAAVLVANDVTLISGDLTISAEITGPQDEAIHPDSVSIYDPAS